jgi:hypothetical protein
MYKVWQAMFSWPCSAGVPTRNMCFNNKILPSSLLYRNASYNFAVPFLLTGKANVMRNKGETKAKYGW